MNTHTRQVCFKTISSLYRGIIDRESSITPKKDKVKITNLNPGRTFNNA